LCSFLRISVEMGIAHDEWRDRFAAYAQAHGARAPSSNAVTPGAAGRLERDLPSSPSWRGRGTRSASHRVLQALARRVPELIGGSADLASSNKTLIEGGGSVARQDMIGRNSTSACASTPWARS